jgi:Peptidase family M23
MRARSVAAVASLLLAACGESLLEPSTSLQLAFPLEGVLNRDFFLHNYVDLDPTTGIRDYACGVKSYDGHEGVDITLPSFAAMDSGVTVKAAAPGVVIVVHDGMFDRNKLLAGGGLGNHVVLQHRDGFTTAYGHMRANSIVVQVGDSVEAGAPLGMVGSSGNSDAPHLHLETRQDDVLVDPFAGDCGASLSQWKTQAAYQDSFLLVASGVTDQAMTLNLAKDPPTPVDTFTTASAQAAMWVMLFNVPAGSTSRWDWYDPSGQISSSFTHTHSVFYSVSWWWSNRSIAGSLSALGTWRVDYSNDGHLLAQRYFELVAAPTAVSPKAVDAAEGAVGGGGAQGDRR